MEKFFYVQLTAAFLFSIGIIILVVRKNIIVQLMGVELMLNAANIALVGFSRQYDQMVGQVAVLLIFVIAAAETAVGLALLIQIYRYYGTMQNSVLATLGEANRVVE